MIEDKIRNILQKEISEDFDRFIVNEIIISHSAILMFLQTFNKEEKKEYSISLTKNQIMLLTPMIEIYDIIGKNVKNIRMDNTIKNFTIKMEKNIDNVVNKLRKKLFEDNIDEEQIEKILKIID